MIILPSNNKPFSTKEERRVFTEFLTDNFEKSERLFDLILDIFSKYDDQHSETTSDENLQNFFNGFESIIATALEIDEEDDDVL